MLLSDTAPLRHMFVAALWALVAVLAHSDAVRAEEVPAVAGPSAPLPDPPRSRTPANVTSRKRDDSSLPAGSGWLINCRVMPTLAARMIRAATAAVTRNWPRPATAGTG